MDRDEQKRAAGSPHRNQETRDPVGDRDGSFNGSTGGGQSGGGAYQNQDERDKGEFKGGQSGQGYYGGGQMGDRNLGDDSHSAASTRGGPSSDDDAGE